MTKSKHLLKTLVISAAAAVLSYIINYYLTAYITEHVGIEAYGFVSISKNLVSYANIIAVALVSFTVRFIAVSYYQGDMAEAKRYYSSSLLASIVLSVVLLAIALLIISRLECLLNIPVELVHSVKLLFVIVFINFCLNTVMTPFSAAAVIHNRLDVVGIVKIAANCLDAVVLVIMFRSMEPAVWFVGVGALTASVVNFAGNAVLTRKLMPQIKFSATSVSLRKVADIVKNGVFTSLNALGNTLNSGLDLIVSNLFLSGVQTGQLAVVKSLSALFTMLLGMIYQPLQPRLIRAYSVDSRKAFVEEMKNAMCLCGLVANVAVAGFIALGGLYYKLWLPGEDSVLLYRITVITILVFLTESVMKPIYYVSTLTLKNQLPCLLTIVSGILNVTSMYLLLKYTNLGLYAVAGTTTVIMLAINLLFNPIYAARCLGISARPLYGAIFRHLTAAAIMVPVFILIAWGMKPAGWLGFLGSAAIMSVIGALIHCVIVLPKKIWKKLLHKK